MDYFLIILLGLLLATLWSQHSTTAELLRQTISRLEREIELLRAELRQMARSRAAEVVPPDARAQAEQVSAEIPKPAKAAPIDNSMAEPLPRAQQAPVVPSGRVEFASPFESPKLVELSFASPPEEVNSPAAEEPTAAPAFSIEERFGTNWLNKLGIAILVIGLAFFLAFQLQSMGPAGKVLSGFSVSVALIAGGAWLERKAPYRVFARAGIGGGWALGFFTTFAMHHIAAAHVLDSLLADLALMLLVACGMVAQSLRYRSQAVTALAFLLGFATLLTSHLQASSGTVIFSLSASAILAAGLVGVTSRRHWVLLELAGLVAVYLTHFVWLSQVLPANHKEFIQFWPSALLILFYWLIFRVAYLVRVPLDAAEERLSSLTAVLNVAGLLALLKYQSAHPELAFWMLLALGAAEMTFAFALRSRRKQSFVVLSTVASVLLVAAVPFKFHGFTWELLWLVQAHVLALAGLRLGEPVFRRLGLLTGLATGAVLAVLRVVPMLLTGQAESPRHFGLIAALAAAAILYWIHAEVYPRRWPQLLESDLERLALAITSWLAVAAASTAIWLALPQPWVPVGWLVFMVGLGFIADRAGSTRFALQSDALVVCSLAGLVGWVVPAHGWNDHRGPLLVALGLLYGGARRRIVPAGLPPYVAPAYTSVAALLLLYTSADWAPANFVSFSWAAWGFVLFAIGQYRGKTYLRWQGLLFAGCAFTRYFLVDLSAEANGPGVPDTANSGGYFSPFNSLLIQTLILLIVGLAMMHRTLSAEQTNSARLERIAGAGLGTLGIAALMAWLVLCVPSYWAPWNAAPEWVAAFWAGIASTLLYAARGPAQRILLAQSIGVALASGCRAILFNLFESRQPAPGALLFIGVAAGVLLAGLPAALRAKNSRMPDRGEQWPNGISTALGYPEQWFFFIPFGMVVLSLAARLSSGHVTIAWSVTGVATFLFALAVGKRSYRLAGLGLLLVSVGKILVLDVWALSPGDRYLTLIVLGLALLSVSFLYTRFSTAIRRYL